MNKIFKYILIVILVVGAFVSYFTDIPLVEYIALATSFAAAGALCSGTIEKSEKKDWKVYLAVICIGLGAFGLGFCKYSGEAITQLITVVVSLVLLITGFFAGSKAEKG